MAHQSATSQVSEFSSWFPVFIHAQVGLKAEPESLRVSKCTFESDSAEMIQLLVLLRPTDTLTYVMFDNSSIDGI